MFKTGFNRRSSVPRLVFPPIHSSLKMRHVIHGGSKICLRQVQSRRILPPPLPLRWRFRVSILPSTRGLKLGRSFDVPLPSNQGPKLEPAHEVLDFAFV
ncbi:hypothetical protein AVEN_18391-1 [Araneus ventricosus]|uniref:Uncharacterized protein n=1 Tax=Araneus ventricosus TaxID=182803 RepID=A0A4Y2P6E0_ARAVE|nr:hypothetical protein AVEN_18391-1 [Araneus ventricosus]